MTGRERVGEGTGHANTHQGMQTHTRADPARLHSKRRAREQDPARYTPNGAHAHSKRRAHNSQQEQHPQQEQIPKTNVPTSALRAYTNPRVAAFSCCLGARRILTTAADTEEANRNAQLSCYPQLVGQSAIAAGFNEKRFEGRERSLKNCPSEAAI